MLRASSRRLFCKTHPGRSTCKDWGYLDKVQQTNRCSASKLRTEHRGLAIVFLAVARARSSVMWVAWSWCVGFTTGLRRLEAAGPGTDPVRRRTEHLPGEQAGRRSLNRISKLACQRWVFELTTSTTLRAAEALATAVSTLRGTVALALGGVSASSTRVSAALAMSVF